MRKSLFVQSLGLVAAMSLIPAVSAGFAATDVDTYKELDQFMSIFEKVKSDYVDKVDDKTLIRGAIDGMLASLDPHSGYLDNRDFTNLKTQTDGNYGGLGLTVQGEDGVIKVVSATEDTPAARAGLKSGDYITNIDNKLIYGTSLDEAVEKMRGAPGTQVRITVVRPGRDKPFDLTLTREVIQIKAVKWEVKGRVGVININSFSKATGPGVKSAIVAINKALGGNPLGYVIDLRENPGGLLDQAVEVSDTFLDHGEIVSQRGREKTDIERFFAHPGDDTHGAPLIVLVDAGTASAAEIVAGALQDQHRAIVMGVRSFGKGSVQTVMPLTDDTALRLTIARYYTPSGRSVQENGIKPDIVVPQVTDPDAKGRPRLREADLRNHLVNQVKADDKLLEEDTNPDPRYAATADALKKAGIEDFQLDYAVKTIARLANVSLPSKVVTATTPGKAVKR
jgi:carboxyl-terminal processing protease